MAPQIRHTVENENKPETAPAPATTPQTAPQNAPEVMRPDGLATPLKPIEVSSPLTAVTVPPERSAFNSRHGNLAISFDGASGLTIGPVTEADAGLPQLRNGTLLVVGGESGKVGVLIVPWLAREESASAEPQMTGAPEQPKAADESESPAPSEGGES